MNRSANHGIKGYLYQFLNTIERILALQSGEEIEIEGIEDIDVHGLEGLDLIQCKYHEAQKFTPSLVYKPIGLMITDYMVNQDDPSTYKLYAHFGESAPQDDLWVNNEFMRKALSKIKNAPTASDAQLAAFKSQFQFLAGISFDAQQEKIKSLLQSEFSCTKSEAEGYYYNNAVTYIAEKSANSDAIARRLNKATFKSAINEKSALFDIWQRELKGKKEYIKLIRDRLTASHILTNDVKRRFLLLSKDFVDGAEAHLSAEQFLVDLLTNYPLKGKLYNTQQWTIIIDAPKQKLDAIKKHLVDNDVYYNDGYESISFSKRYFNDMPVMNTKETTRKITKISHMVRIVSLETFKQRMLDVLDDNQNMPHAFINMGRSMTENQYFLGSSVSVFRLSAVQDFVELLEILKKGRK
jgi:hypothetical protein